MDQEHFNKYATYMVDSEDPSGDGIRINMAKIPYLEIIDYAEVKEDRKEKMERLMVQGGRSPDDVVKMSVYCPIHGHFDWWFIKKDDNDLFSDRLCPQCMNEEMQRVIAERDNRDREKKLKEKELAEQEKNYGRNQKQRR